MSKDVTQTIIQLARKHGIDPSAAIAVARGEGGLANRPDDVGDLSGGGSYGPFQLYTKGELPKQYHGKPQVADSWAWSPAGIDYALSRMASYGAKGLTGPQAVEAIIRKFERPADPDKSVQLALSRLPSSKVAPAPASPLAQNPLLPSFSTEMPQAATVSPRRQFALDTLKSISTGDFSPVSMLRSLTQDFNRAYGGQEIPGSAGLKFPKVRGTVTPEVAPIVQEAYKWLGTPYSWAGGGTKGPSKGVGRGANTVGFDCVAAGVPIETDRGPIPIEQIEAGDRVLTRNGYRRVIAAWKVGEADVYRVRTPGGCEIVATEDHRIWTENRGWIALSTSDTSDTFITWQRPTSSSSRACGTTATPSRLGRLTATTTSALAALFTGLYGKTRTDRSFPATRYTIAMATPSTTTSGTWSASLSPTTDVSQRTLAEWSITSASSVDVTSVEWHVAGSALLDASSATASRWAWIRESSCVRAAARLARAATSAPRSTAHTAARSPLTGAEYAGKADVYDLEVEGEHEFFAGGILVHNCSGFLQYLMGKKGVAIPRVTYDQWRTGTPVDKEALEPGDAVFFRMGERGPEHVGVYAGNNQFIHAPKTGDVVKVSSLSGYYARNFVGGRRYE